MGYKICVYAICKNESAFVDRWLNSMSEADLVVVTDTGSEDDTVQKLRAGGAQVYIEQVVPWRFDTARNLSLDHLPEDADLCVCTDLDEVFEPGWREKLETAWRPSFTRARYLFTSDFDENQRPINQFLKEKIHRREGFRWVHPVHEVLEYRGDDPDQIAFVPGLVLNHHPDPGKPRTQYLPLLELSAEENPDDSQTAFWLGREYFYRGRHDRCMAEMERYLALPSSTWGEERSAAMRFLAGSCEAKGESSKAKAWLYRAIAECPDIREPYLWAARLGYAQSDWNLTYAMVKNALAIPRPSGSYLAETACWGSALCDLGAISSYRLGLFWESREYAARALELEPGNPRLEQNLQTIEATISAWREGGMADAAL